MMFYQIIIFTVDFALNFIERLASKSSIYKIHRVGQEDKDYPVGLVTMATVT